MRNGLNWTKKGPKPGRRGLGALIGVAALAVAVVPSAAGGQASGSEPTATADATGRILLTCDGATEADQAALSALQLRTSGIDTTVVMPSRTELGQAAVASVELSYEFPEILVGGAKALGIDTVDLTGTQFSVSLLAPGAELQATATPPTAVIDARTPGRIDLGSVRFDVPTEQPGAVQVVVTTSSLAFVAAPNGPSGKATCTSGATNDLPVGFIIDPLAPIIDPAARDLPVEENAGSVDLTQSVTAGSGPIVAESWRVVRSAGVGEADLDGGVLDFEFDGSGIDVVWEVCGLDAPPPTTTTTTTTIDTGDSIAEDNQAGVELQASGDDESDAIEHTEESLEQHCAQGVVSVRRAHLGANVLNATLGSQNGSIGSPNDVQSTAGGAPIAFTG